MRSPDQPSRHRAAAVTAVLAATMACTGYGARAATVAPTSAEAVPARVEAAVEALRHDPLMGGTKHEGHLRWKRDDPDDETIRQPSPWLAGLVRWLSESGRLIVWVLGAIALTLLALRLRHFLRWRGARAKPPADRPPSHVRDLDIRPDSLPGDVGAAARLLWERGEHRAALSLLYRGALSRLVHAHHVPIRAASTEGECVQLAARRLPATSAGFFASLVEAWRLGVYGGRDPASADVLRLCDEFDRALPDALPEGTTR